jgi:glutamyl/glutaminyl-tRNA synthetase
MAILESQDPPIHLSPSFELIKLRKAWFLRLIEVYLPYSDHLDELPAKAAPIFVFDPEAARRNPENSAILSTDNTRIVLSELAHHLRTHASYVTPEDFKNFMNEIKAATGIKGKELFHPVRIALTGHHSGPDFDKLIPLIEDGASLGLPIRTIHDRIEQFTGA